MRQVSLFDDINRPTKAEDKEVLNNLTKKKIAPAKRGGSKSSKINAVREFVEKHLGKYRDDYVTITTVMQLEFYIRACIEAKCVSIDTETTGLDPMLDKVVGVCLYYPNGPAAYIPLLHVSYITGELLEGQLSYEIVAKYLERLVGIEELEMFNAKFDTRFIYHSFGVKLHCTWDGYIAARLMNENEEHRGLKYLHSKYILEGKEDEFSFGEIFKGVSFIEMPLDIATLYGAHDSVITHELIEFQKKYMYYEPECEFSARNGMNGVAWCFFNIEMPLIDVLCEVEDNGVLVDEEYTKKLSEEYHKKKEQALDEFYTALIPYNDTIRMYGGDKLDNPINIGSPTQLAILFYDILGYEVVDPKSPRGTGEAIMQKWNTPLTQAILKYRAIDKLIGTYIDKIPAENVNPNDGRVHCNYNQYGADTGRMSSDKPNMQNIPSHNKEIRKMFVASPGYVLLSSDYSQQEPSCLASLCKEMGYDALFNARFSGKDLYSSVASACYNRAYEDCVEFNADGSKNPEGKKYRNLAKPVLLGILYGRGDKSVAEGMNITVEEAKQLKKNLFKKYPEIMIFEQKSLQMAEELGYVTTICGRKRRLPDLQLDEFEFKWVDAPKSDDVLDFDGEIDTEVPEELCKKYLRKLNQARFGQKRKIFEEANQKDGIWIVDNGAKIADATRQCVNARIQGSAADVTKLAMILVTSDERLRELGFKLLISVHDELIGECPEQNAKECAKRLAEVMSEAAEKVLGMPFKCDVEVTKQWYGESVEV